MYETLSRPLTPATFREMEIGTTFYDVGAYSSDHNEAGPVRWLKVLPFAYRWRSNGRIINAVGERDRLNCSNLDSLRVVNFSGDTPCLVCERPMRNLLALWPVQAVPLEAVKGQREFGGIIHFEGMEIDIRIRKADEDAS